VFTESIWLLVGMALNYDKLIADIVKLLDIVNRTGKTFVASNVVVYQIWP